MSNIKVLVVEDNQALRIIAKKMLEKFNYEVLEASNGEEGLKMISMYNDVKLVFLDVMMPKMGGEEFLERIKTLKSEMGFKICMLTSKDLYSDVKKFLIKGADDYIVKPLDKDVFIEKAKILTQGIGQKIFASVETKFQAKILRVGSVIEIFITNMSESEIKFKSQMALPIGAKILVESKDLSLIFINNDPILMRIYSCEKNGKEFIVCANFIGLNEINSKRIRSVTTRWTEEEEENEEDKVS